jgi:hypothetical protein
MSTSQPSHKKANTPGTRFEQQHPRRGRRLPNISTLLGNSSRSVCHLSAATAASGSCGSWLGPTATQRVDGELHAVTPMHTSGRLVPLFRRRAASGIGDLRQHPVPFGWGGPDQEADLPPSDVMRLARLPPRLLPSERSLMVVPALKGV